MILTFNPTRRGFLKQLLVAGGSFVILPSASFYKRVWKENNGILVIDEEGETWVYMDERGILTRSLVVPAFVNKNILKNPTTEQLEEFKNFFNEEPKREEQPILVSKVSPTALELFG